MRATKQFLILVLGFLLWTGAVQAGDASASTPMYKWYDEEGNLNYTQVPPPEGVKTERVQVQVNVVEDEYKAKPQGSGNNQRQGGATATSKTSGSLGGSGRSSASTGGSNK